MFPPGDKDIRCSSSIELSTANGAPSSVVEDCDPFRPIVCVGVKVPGEPFLSPSDCRGEGQSLSSAVVHEVPDRWLDTFCNKSLRSVAGEGDVDGGGGGILFPFAEGSDTFACCGLFMMSVVV